MICFPGCKINIGLYITNKRADGYHDLETVFYPVSLNDALEVVPASIAEIHMYGMEIQGSKHNNLVWKAYDLLKQKYAEIPELDVHLIKNIPMGAGLGGGSADGAFMLRLLNEYCQLGINKETLIQYALQLGSDCPFFIENIPQFATGRGERLFPLQLDLSGYSIQLVCPEVHISTAAAFNMIRPKPASFDLRKLAEMPIERWAEYVSNDFEEPIFIQHPELADIKQRLYDSGALYAALSGSGSTIYGIFEKGRKADMAYHSEYIK